MKLCMHCSAPAVEQYTFVLDGDRVLGEAWLCRACLDTLLTTDRITIAEDSTRDYDATKPL